jgi:hypothetical protein
MRRCTGPCDKPKPPDAFYDARARCMECIRVIERARYWRNRAARLAMANAYWNRTKEEREGPSSPTGEGQC